VSIKDLESPRVGGIIRMESLRDLQEFNMDSYNPEWDYKKYQQEQDYRESKHRAILGLDPFGFNARDKREAKTAKAKPNLLLLEEV
jgi:hypothetical protein